MLKYSFAYCFIFWFYVLWGQPPMVHHKIVLHIYAVVVGINSGADQGRVKLNYAKQNAMAFGKFLASPKAGAVSAANIQLLTGDNDTWRHIRKPLLSSLSSYFKVV